MYPVTWQKRRTAGRSAARYGRTTTSVMGPTSPPPRRARAVVSFGGDGRQHVELGGPPGRPAGRTEAQQRGEDQEHDQAARGDHDVGDALLLQRRGEGGPEGGPHEDADDGAEQRQDDGF